MGIQVEQTVYEVLPTGEYLASVSEIEQEDGQFGQQLKFVFEVGSGDFEGVTLWGWTSMKFSNKSKLYKWTKAAFGGADVPQEYTFDSDDLLGRKVVLTVVVNTKDDGSEFNRVDAVKPYRQPKTGNGAQAAPPSPPPPPTFEDEEIPF
jgi:hypothetical protein